MYHTDCSRDAHGHMGVCAHVSVLKVIELLLHTNKRGLVVIETG